MRSFNHVFTVRSSLPAVVEFHRDPHALRRLTPPLIRLAFRRAEPLAEGSISEFVMWLGPIPIRWVAEHIQVDPQLGFTDRQLMGPMQQWQHTHRFEFIGKDKTRIHDHIELLHHSGARGLITRVLFSRLALKALFAFRKAATRRAVEAGASIRNPLP